MDKKLKKQIKKKHIETKSRYFTWMLFDYLNCSSVGKFKINKKSYIMQIGSQMKGKHANVKQTKWEFVLEGQNLAHESLLLV